MVVDHHSAEEFPTMQGYLQKKRKSRDVICLSPEKSNEDTEERKGSRQKKSTEETSTPDRKRHRAQVSREPPTGYIYVRAKRGQATDSHSLAERVRREKINQRMKLLQGIVPGCDKIAGKILMLDEIINYVLSLQRQVEFLSMKLASMDPKFCGLFAASIGYVNQQQETGKMPQLSVPVQSVLRNSAIQQVAFDEATGNSISHPLVHGQGATGIPSGCFTATIPSGKMPQFPQVVALHGQTFLLPTAPNDTGILSDTVLSSAVALPVTCGFRTMKHVSSRRWLIKDMNSSTKYSSTTSLSFQ